MFTLYADRLRRRCLFWRQRELCNPRVDVQLLLSGAREGTLPLEEDADVSAATAVRHMLHPRNLLFG